MKHDVTLQLNPLQLASIEMLLRRSAEQYAKLGGDLSLAPAASVIGARRDILKAIDDLRAGRRSAIAQLHWSQDQIRAHAFEVRRGRAAAAYHEGGE